MASPSPEGRPTSDPAPTPGGDGAAPSRGVLRRALGAFGWRRLSAGVRRQAGRSALARAVPPGPAVDGSALGLPDLPAVRPPWALIGRHHLLRRRRALSRWTSSPEVPFTGAPLALGGTSGSGSPAAAGRPGTQDTTGRAGLGSRTAGPGFLARSEVPAPAAARPLRPAARGHAGLTDPASGAAGTPGRGLVVGDDGGAWRDRPPRPVGGAPRRLDDAARSATVSASGSPSTTDVPASPGGERDAVRRAARVAAAASATRPPRTPWAGAPTPRSRTSGGTTATSGRRRGGAAATRSTGAAGATVTPLSADPTTPLVAPLASGPRIEGAGVDSLRVAGGGGVAGPAVAGTQEAFRATPGHASPMASPTPPALSSAPRNPRPPATGTTRSGGAPSRATSADRTTLGRDASLRPASPAQAADRWTAAVRRRPLETPQLFPTAWRSWASAVSGRSAVRWTAGAATSAALSEAGARAATSGDVVHLAVAPRWGAAPRSGGHGPAGAGVSRGHGDDHDDRTAAGSGSSELVHLLAHELAHLREPLTRPRFLLADPHAARDADEHRAHRFAAEVTRFPRMGSLRGGLGQVAAGVVDSLPVAAASGPRAVAAIAESAAGQVRDQVQQQVEQQVRAHVQGAIAQAAQALPAPAAQALAAAMDGGLQGLASSATQAASDLGSGAVSSALAQAGGLGGGLGAGLAGAANAVASGQGFDLAAVAGQVSGPIQGGIADLTSAAGTAITGAAGAAASGPAAALAALAGAGNSLTHLPHETVDRIVEALEHRILAEIERRGGRYTGSF